MPQITDEFKSVTDIGWYGSAYLLATCAFQLLFGKLYTFYSIKTIFLTSITLFEIGSAVCGAAPTSVAFIIGRAVSGVGAAGIFSGVVRFFSFSLYFFLYLFSFSISMSSMTERLLEPTEFPGRVLLYIGAEKTRFMQPRPY